MAVNFPHMHCKHTALTHTQTHTRTKWRGKFSLWLVRLTNLMLAMCWGRALDWWMNAINKDLLGILREENVVI